MMTCYAIADAAERAVARGFFYQMGRMLAPLAVLAAVLVILGLYCVVQFMLGKERRK